LSLGEITFIEFVFLLDTEPEPFSVHVSHPGYVLSDRKISNKSRKLIQTYLDMTGLCSKQDIKPKAGLEELFSWAARVKYPTMSQHDFEQRLGRCLFNELRIQGILGRHDEAQRVLCDNLKDHHCTQKIIENYRGKEGEYAIYCPVNDKHMPISEKKIKRYTVHMASLIQFLRNTLSISGTRETKENEHGLIHIGETIWGTKRRRVYYAPQIWKEQTLAFLEKKESYKEGSYNRKDIIERTLVLSPAPWIAFSKYPQRYNFAKRVKMFFLKDLFEFKNERIAVADQFKDAIASTPLYVQGPYALACDVNGLREITKSEYKVLYNKRAEYDCFLDTKKSPMSRFVGGIRKSKMFVES